MNARRMCCFFAFLFIMTNAAMSITFAGSQTTTNSGWFVGASGGASWLSGSSNMTINNGYDTSPDTYSINSLDTTGNISAEAGYRFGRESRYLPYISWDLQYLHVFSSSLSGVVDEYSLPHYKNYNYQMNFDANDIHTLLKLDFYQFNRFMPYLEGGIGVGINTLAGYQEQPVTGIYPRVSPDFKSNTEVSFSYVVGTGLDFIISPHWWITLGYKYINQGNVTSGQRTDGFSSHTLDPGHIQNQMIFGGISYQFFNRLPE